MKQTYPQLFVFKEKYGDYYFLVDNTKEKKEMFLKILQDRWDDNWYSWMENDSIANNRTFKEIKQTIETKDGVLAYNMIDALSDDQYGGYSRVDFITFKK